MTAFLPITLSGNNLGERHRHLNTLLKNAFQLLVPFESIEDIPETSPVDRLFKIDLASKCRNVDYIIKNLKDKDMLYVSRALKCKWLLESEYETKINANFLENELFPEMITTAVNKMLHWIQHNLRDPERCRDFYNYYKEKEFILAIKFLWQCSSEYVLEEFKNVIGKIEPHDLKALSEKCPIITEMFYNNIKQNRGALKRYLDNENSFFYNIKYILKLDPDIFFHVVEKYFNVQKFRTFGPDVTKYIMINHKQRFCCKPELYTAWLLDIHILAKCLSPEEVKDVIIKLAKAEYLGDWFTYKTVEPLIKRLNKDERAAFKKRMFVDYDFGAKIKDWPYSPPSSPIIEEVPGCSLFRDQDFDLVYPKKITKRLIKKRKGSFSNYKIEKCRTLLDVLFDRYRFMSFEATLYELRKRIRAESKLQNREYMILVLVSKSGGREDSLRILFELLLQYRNEPVHFRAAIVRSLVKRAFVWRLPDDLWANLLQWAHGMGLDGRPAEIICTEGLHAVVLRNLLADQTSNPFVAKQFFDNFTYFTQYSLTTSERSFLRTRLPKLLLYTAASEMGTEKIKYLEQMLFTLEEYKVRFDRISGVVEAIANAAQEDLESANFLLLRLYNARIARKLLFKENFSIIQNNASYINALRHDVSIIRVDQFKAIVENESPARYEQYFKKLVIYFGESGGLAEQCNAFFKCTTETNPHKCLAKPLSILSGTEFSLVFEAVDNALKKSSKQTLAAALRSNAHNSRPRFDLDAFGWQKAGAKAIANQVSVSPQNQRKEIVQKLITWKRTIRLALTLSESDDARCVIYEKMAKLRPGATLKIFLRYLKIGQLGSGFNAIWHIVKPLISELEYVKRPRLLKSLENIEYVPDSVKSEYCVLVYEASLKIDNAMALRMLCNIVNICHDVNQTFLSTVVSDLLENEIIEDKIVEDTYLHRQNCSLYIRLIAKYLLLNKTEESQKERLDYLKEHLFQCIEEWWIGGSLDKNILIIIVDSFLEALKYNKVFFDAKYVSCMPVFEYILQWLHNMLAIEKWFHVYINIHLTILYYKSTRFCINQKPEFFIGKPTNLDKGAEMLGTVFGKFVTHDYEELKAKYFQSIREIYKEEVMKYLINMIDYTTYDQSKERFVIYFINSILGENNAKEAHLLANYIFIKHLNHFKYGYDIGGIMDKLKEAKTDELRLYFEIESNIYDGFKIV